jgi:hypothetical protein
MRASEDACSRTLGFIANSPAIVNMIATVTDWQKISQYAALLAGLVGAVAGVITFYGIVSSREAAQQARQEAQNIAVQQRKDELDDPEPEHPQVKSTTCLIDEARTSETKTSTAESPELIVVVSVPSYAQECHDNVTVDAPTFGLGKKPEQSVDVVPPAKSDTERWLLEPEKPGSWNVAVETQEDRERLPMAVTTPLGFSAAWVQIGAIVGAVSAIALGVLTLILRRGE